MRNIQEYGQKIKGWLDIAIGEWGLFALILLAALGSFGLGRLSALESARPVVSITQAAAAAAPGPIIMGGQFVASRTGTVYYYPWCTGATKISPNNQRWFASEKEARAAGLRPAKNCKGLESK